MPHGAHSAWKRHRAAARSASRMAAVLRRPQLPGAKPSRVVACRPRIRPRRANLIPYPQARPYARSSPRRPPGTSSRAGRSSGGQRGRLRQLGCSAGQLRVPGFGLRPCGPLRSRQLARSSASRCAPRGSRQSWHRFSPQAGARGLLRFLGSPRTASPMAGRWGKQRRGTAAAAYGLRLTMPGSGPLWSSDIFNSAVPVAPVALFSTWHTGRGSPRVSAAPMSSGS